MSEGRAQALLGHIRRLAGSGYLGEASDADLLALFAQSGDESAFEELVRRHGPLVGGVCRRVLGHEQDAEDAFQAAFLVLARKASGVRWRTAIGPWLYQVAFRLAQKARAQRARRARREEAVEPGLSAPCQDDMTWRELRQVLDEELARLPEKYRAPLVLCYLEGKTRDETAELLGWSTGAVKGCLERGRDLLRANLLRRGLTLPAALLTAFLAGSACAALSPHLLHTTARAATLFAARQSVVDLVSAQTLALTQGALHAMFLSKILSAGAVLLALALAAGASLAARSQTGREAEDPARVRPDRRDGRRDPGRRDSGREPARRDGRRDRGRREDRPARDPRRERGNARPRPNLLGVVASLDKDKRTLTVRVSSRGGRSEVRTFTLAKGAEVLVDGGKKGTLGELSRGIRVALVVDRDGKSASSIIATGPRVRGSIASVDVEKRLLAIDFEEDGGKTYLIDKDAALIGAGGRRGRGEAVKLADLKVGQPVLVQVSVDRKRALRVSPLEVATARPRERSGQRPGARSRERPGTRDGRAGERPGARRGERPGTRSRERPGQRRDPQPDRRRDR